MEIKIKSPHYELPTAISDYIIERASTLEKLIRNNADLALCEIEIVRDDGRSRHGDHVWAARVNLSYPGGMVRATNHAATINAAIDDVKEEIEGRLRKEKTKRFNKMRQMGARLKEWMRFGGGESDA